MRSNTARAAAGVAVVVLAIVLFIVLQGGDDDEGSTPTQTTDQPTQEPQQNGDGTETPTPPEEPAEPTVQTVEIRGGAPVGGLAEIEATSGDTVGFRVVSDEPGDVHIHGYEIEKPVTPGKPLELSFPAEIEGSFEVELHGEGGEFQIAELSVSPA